MTDEVCPYEDSIAQAINTGQWNEDLRTHVTRCENCAEAVQMSFCMSNLAGRWRSAEPVPNPNLIWLKAQLAAQQQLEKRALRLAILGQAVALFSLLVILSVLILRIWQRIDMFIVRRLLWLPDRLLSPSIPLIEGPLGYLTSPAFVFLCFCFVCFFLLPRWRAILES